MAKFCVKCGTPLEEGTVFCPECGTKQPAPAPMRAQQPAYQQPAYQQPAYQQPVMQYGAQAPAKKSKKGLVIALIVIFLLICVGTAIYIPKMLYDMSHKKDEPFSYQVTEEQPGNTIIRNFSGKYTGEWKDDRPDGFGTFTGTEITIKYNNETISYNADFTFEGEWKDGQFTGNSNKTVATMNTDYAGHNVTVAETMEGRFDSGIFKSGSFCERRTDIASGYYMETTGTRSENSNHMIGIVEKYYDPDGKEITQEEFNKAIEG